MIPIYHPSSAIHNGYFQAPFYRFLKIVLFYFVFFGVGGGEMLKYFVVGAQRAFQNNLGWRHVQVDSDSV